MHSLSSFASRFAPKLETLEAREVPAVQVLVTNHLLQIMGDNQANTINIHDNGQGTIQVTIGNEKFTVDGISAVKIDTRAGADTVKYQLTGTLKETESITANLGKGADDATFNFLAGVGSTGHLTLKVNDGAGADQNGVKMGAIALGGSASVAINAGTGSDTISLHTPTNEVGKLVVSLKQI